MQLSTKEDIEAPIDQVFRMVTDFEALERQAMRRGAEVRRVDTGDKGVGMTWHAAFPFRGKDREVEIVITEYEPPHRIVAQSTTGGLEAVCVLDLVALSKRRTRMSLDVDMSAGNLSARLLLQSLKLARGKLTKRYHLRVAEYARDLEERFQRKV